MPDTLERALTWLEYQFGLGEMEYLGRPCVPDDTDPVRLRLIEERLAELLPV